MSHIDPLAKAMFVLVSGILEVRLRFGCRDDGERQDWMKWLMRATEQDFKPQMDDKKGGWGNGCGYVILQHIKWVKGQHCTMITITSWFISS